MTHFFKTYLFLSLVSIGLAFSASTNTALDLSNQLCDAIEKHDLAAVRQAIAAGANVNGIGGGRDPLSCALWYCNDKAHEVIIRELLQHKSLKINAYSNRYLFLCMRNKVDPEIFSTLISKGIYVNPRTEQQIPSSPHAVEVTALKYAVEHNLIEYAKILIATPNIDIEDGSPLETALRNNYQELVELLVTAGANVDTEIKRSDDQRMPLLIAAVMEDNLELVQRILSSTTCNVDAQYKAYAQLHGSGWGYANNGSALTQAVLGNKKIEIVHALIAHGANPNIPNNQGRYPLQHAVENNNEQLVAALLASKDIDLTLPNLPGRNPLELAMTNKNGTIINMLLNASPVEDLPANLFDSAITENNEALVNTLIQKGVTPTTHQLKLALRSAQPNLSMITNLVNAIDNINEFIGSDGLYRGKESPLSAAIRLPDQAISDAVVDLIIGHKNFDPQQHNSAHNHPVKTAIDSNNLVAAQKLMACKVPLAPTSLHDAITSGRDELVALLATDKSLLERKDGNHRTPLQAAIQNKSSPKIVATLIDAGASIKVRDDWGNSLLHNTNCTDEAAAVLIAKGANVHAKNTYERTPLFDAVSRNNIARIQALLAAKADPNVRDRSGATPLSLAQPGHKEALEKILSTPLPPARPASKAPQHPPVEIQQDPVVEAQQNPAAPGNAQPSEPAEQPREPQQPIEPQPAIIAPAQPVPSTQGTLPRKPAANRNPAAPAPGTPSPSTSVQQPPITSGSTSAASSSSPTPPTTEESSLKKNINLVRAVMLLPLAIAGLRSWSAFTDAKKMIAATNRAAHARNADIELITDAELNKQALTYLWKKNKVAVLTFLGLCTAEASTLLV